jgi:DNA-binding PadR family transcriptional regulator
MPGMWGPPGFGRGRGPRARRGNVRAAILSLLGERSMHGYEIIQELEERSGGVWRPSPGSVYPTLQMLEDQGLVAGEDADGKRRFSLTEEGRSEAGKSSSETPPWEEMAGGAESTSMRLRDAAFQVGAAAMQVAHAGSEEQADKAIDMLAETRRRLYAMLGEDE